MKREIIFSYTSPRWAGMSGFIRQIALRYGIVCSIEVRKWLVTEDGTVRCNGDAHDMELSEQCIHLSIADYNR